MASSLPDPFAAAARAGGDAEQQEQQDAGLEQTAPPKLYLGYGSNLSTTQMAARCPASPAIGLGRLRGASGGRWSWIINDRGYANVVQKQGQGQGQAGSDPGPEAGVYGVLYLLDPADEKFLDRCESVPDCYEKETHDVEVLRWAWPASSSVSATYTSRSHQAADQDETGGKGGNDKDDDDDDEPTVMPALVYVDRGRTQPSTPKEEYIARMNRGIDEATRQWGLPRWYVEDVMRPLIPAPSETERRT